MKMRITVILWVFMTSCVFAQVPTPKNFSASWVHTQPPGTPAPPVVHHVQLTWDDVANETSYTVQRKIGYGTVWVDVNAAVAMDMTTCNDTTLPSMTQFGVCFYRLRAKNGSVTSAPAEVVLAGRQSTSEFDDDADGLDNAVESNSAYAGLLDIGNWADASGDLDGDGIPNAWEVDKGTDLNSATSTPTPDVTVDPGRPVTATNVWTITAALAKLASTTTHPNNSHRIIRVKPGVYRENISKTIVCNVAIVPDRTPNTPSERFEIRGVHATNAVISVTTGSLVLDGFILTRDVGTSGPVLSVTEDDTPANRISIVRLVNCLVNNVDSGTSSLVVHDRGRLVLSHCTFFMNFTQASQVAHTYSTGILASNASLNATARLKVHNCVFWNPISTFIPEFQSVGDSQFITSIVYKSSHVYPTPPPQGVVVPVYPEGCLHLNPGFTPRGYVAKAPLPPAQLPAGTIVPLLGLGVLRDIHGEVRYDPTVFGADDWVNQGDTDLIPDFADGHPTSNNNQYLDEDSDGFSDILEFLGGTSIYAADSPYLTLDQAIVLFGSSATSDDVYTKSEVYTKTQADSLFYTKADATYLSTKTETLALLQTFHDDIDSEFVKKTDVLRVPARGDISMGQFTSGTAPAGN